MIAYSLLFASAFLAATILPMQSEAVLVGLLVAKPFQVWSLVVVATLGNVLGSVVNWGLGRMVLRFQHARWFPASDAQLARAQGWYQRYGRWSLLASWVPIVGDPLTVVAGVLREPLLPFVVLRDDREGRALRGLGGGYSALGLIGFGGHPGRPPRCV